MSSISICQKAYRSSALMRCMSISDELSHVNAGERACSTCGTLGTSTTTL